MLLKSIGLLTTSESTLPWRCLRIVQPHLEPLDEIGSGLARSRLSLIHLSPDAVVQYTVARHERIDPIIASLWVNSWLSRFSSFAGMPPL